MDVYVLEPGGTGLRVTSEDGLVPALRRLLPVDDITVVTTGGTAVTQIREQWDDGNNTVAIEPGVVVAYARNTETNARLRDAGIEVLELDASELCRGRGGSRCMTQPVWRDPVEW
jgi:arginine deiminase